MMLDKTALLSAVSLKTEPVSIGGDQVLVSEISAGDWFKIWQEGSDGNAVEMSEFTIRLLLYSLVDESGQRLFEDTEKHLVERFPPAVFATLAEAAKQINGITGDETKN